VTPKAAQLKRNRVRDCGRAMETVARQLRKAHVPNKRHNRISSIEHDENGSTLSDLRLNMLGIRRRRYPEAQSKGLRSDQEVGRSRKP
jgi:hypothetical protein